MFRYEKLENWYTSVKDFKYALVTGAKKWFWCLNIYITVQVHKEYQERYIKCQSIIPHPGLTVEGLI